MLKRKYSLGSNTSTLQVKYEYISIEQRRESQDQCVVCVKTLANAANYTLASYATPQLLYFRQRGIASTVLSYDYYEIEESEEPPVCA